MNDSKNTVSASDLFREFDGDPDYERERLLAVPRTNLAVNVNRLRRARGMTQADLAAATGMRQPRVAEIEGGEANPRQDTVIKLAVALGVSVAKLYSDPVTAAREPAVKRHAAPSPFAVVSRGYLLGSWEDAGCALRTTTADIAASVAADNFALEA